MTFKIPHVFIFLSIIILFCSLLTYVIPSGSFERTTRKYGKIEQSVVVPGSYKEVPKHFSVKGIFLNEKEEGKSTPISLLGLLTAIPKGMQQSAALIFFLFIVGAIFNVIIYTGTINAVLFFLIEKFRHTPTILFFMIYLAVSMASSFLGVAAELIPMIPIILLMTKELGYDRMFGFALITLPIFIGWATAITNPFNVTIAQQIAELPLGSGMGFRVVLFIVFLVLGFSYLMWYGKRIKHNKIKPFEPLDSFKIDGIENIKKESFTTKHFLILAVLVIGYSIIMISVQTIGWGLIEMTGGFIGIGIMVILISGLSGDESMKAFVKGLETMIIPALIVGVARGISVVMQEGMIIDTILANASNNLMTMPKFVAAEGMLIFQSTLNFFHSICLWPGTRFYASDDTSIRSDWHFPTNRCTSLCSGRRPLKYNNSNKRGIDGHVRIGGHSFRKMVSLCIATIFDYDRNCSLDDDAGNLDRVLSNIILGHCTI